MEIINRPDYTEKVMHLFGKGLIIALTGQRRVGKSFIMKQIINLLETEKSNNIIYVDKDDERFNFIRSHVELTEYIEGKLISGENNYLFVDEVQNIRIEHLSFRSLYRISHPKP